MAVVNLPTTVELMAVGRQLGLNLSEQDAAFFLETMGPNVAAYNALAAAPDNLPPVKYPRTPGYRPEGEENKYNLWYRKSEIAGAPGGKLAGKRVVLKDNVCLAGVPMMNGASTLEGYMPDVDATVVTRLLDAGATILGKVHCECFCFSGGSHTGAAGPVHNPRKFGFSAGGSSSGSAAAIVTGEADMAIGGDQGGSIRIPAAYCGIYGLKPTWGLVPYTGIMPIEATLDHTGPMTGTVADNALMLEAIAGPDGLDPRQAGCTVDKYTDALKGSAAGLKIAVVKEGFSHPQSEAVVDTLVRRGAEKLKQLGGQVDEVSIPMHIAGMPIWVAIALEGATSQMMLGNGYGFNWKGLYVTSLIDAHSAWRSRADELSDTLKTSMLFGQYALNKYRGHFYAKAQNLARKLTAAYDAALSKYDLLLMPTLPLRATKLPDPAGPRMDGINRGFEMLPNTAPFDVTGHPAMSLPCGMSDGLPAGLMLIGKHWNESVIYRAAHAFEQSQDWTKLTA
jgi:amidase